MPDTTANAHITHRARVRGTIEQSPKLSQKHEPLTASQNGSPITSKQSSLEDWLYARASIRLAFKRSLRFSVNQNIII